MFTVALFTIANKWKQPKHLTADEWIHKMCYIHTMDYYPAIKRNWMKYCVLNAKTWVNAEKLYFMKKASHKDYILTIVTIYLQHLP